MSYILLACKENDMRFTMFFEMYGDNVLLEDVSYKESLIERIDLFLLILHRMSDLILDIGNIGSNPIIQSFLG